MFDEARLKKILLDEDYVNAEDLKKAEDFATHHNTSLVDYLLNEEIISQDLLSQALAESYKVPYSNITAHFPSKKQILQIPPQIAQKRRVVLFSKDTNKVVITTDNPIQEGLLEELKNIFPGVKIIFSYSPPEQIDSVLLIYQDSLKEILEQIIKEKENIAPHMLQAIFADAFKAHSSDIHFEVQDEGVIIRFRVDGVLFEAGKLSEEYYENILNVIKVAARLPIDEHYTPQDGSIRYKYNDSLIDLRVSIMPTIYGEKIVIRILSQYVASFNMADLGLSEKHKNILEKAYKKPFGMILVTGPTGSGKSTTLYSILKQLNNPEINITTIEDPVEYKLQGLNQIQVDPAKKLTFAAGLRHIVRQDPDIILVGEIRDNETAEISINAALTGHLLLSTFHANDAATAIPRLLDMEVEPFLLASTLEVLIAQRLVRKICPQCRYTYNQKVSDLKNMLGDPKKYFSQASITLYKGKGCAACGHSGYKGRIALYEFIQATPEMKDLIVKNPITQDIWKLAKKQGSITLFEDGIEKVKNGLTTIQELLRVVAAPEIKK